MTTYAFTGKEPNLGEKFVKALDVLAANLIFFTPRRRVKITIEVVDPKSLPGLTREKFNPYIEAWYNKGLSTEPIFVPYHFLFGPRTFDYPKPKMGLDVPLEKITPATQKAVFDILEEKLKRPLTTAEKQFSTPLENLGLDSLDRMDLAQIVEQRFGFRSDLVATNIGELAGLAQGLIAADTGAPIKVPEAWTTPRANADATYSIAGATLLEAFVRQALAHPNEAAAADDLSGVVTYARLLTGVRLMAKRFAILPGDAVGLMLPASVAADTAFIGAPRRQKTPRPPQLDHRPRQPQPRRQSHGHPTRRYLQKIHRPRRHQNRRRRIRFPGRPPQRHRQSGSPHHPPRCAPLPESSPRRVAQGRSQRPRPCPLHLRLRKSAQGRPAHPPQPHHHVQVGGSNLEFKRGDILLGFLPPFHSFGIAGNVILPLLGGLRVVHHADPTDAKGLVRKIAAYKPTILLSTPTFFSYILNAAKPGDLDSLRTVVTGAEKCPDALFERAKKLAPNATVSEGYGITECSPVVSANRPGNVRTGTIGQPLDGVDVLVVDPETMQPLPVDQRGLLLVHGPTIFPGYLHYDGPSPFHEHDGKRWYITGDLVRIDKDGFLNFAGRLKRFIKSGGEMISLPALEEPLASAYPPGDKGPQVAVEGIETPDGRRIVLFTTVADLKLADANALLTQAGFRGIMRLDEVRHLAALPLLGTGKIDYKVLRAQIT